MIVKSVHDVERLLDECRAHAIGEPSQGGKFYEIKNQLLRYPDGEIQHRDYIDKRRASVVVPITEEGNFVFVIQPIGLVSEGSLVEFPSGYWEIGESGSQAGIRELAEETGYTTDVVITYTGSHYQDPSSIRQQVDTYVAIQCRKTQEQRLDRGEFIKVLEVPLKIVDEMLAHGYFSDANTFIALFKACRAIGVRLM